MSYILLTLLATLFSTNTQARTIPVNNSSSVVEWSGTKKFFDENHFGHVQIKNGAISIDPKGHLQGGTIVIDMNSIENLDLSGSYKQKIEEHLKSPDFFDVRNNPEAVFKIVTAHQTAPQSYEVSGNLTIRGITHPESFILRLEKKGKTYLAQGEISIDRTKYGVSYNPEASAFKKMASVPKDKIISNKIDLKLNLQTQSL